MRTHKKGVEGSEQGRGFDKTQKAAALGLLGLYVLQRKDLVLQDTHSLVVVAFFLLFFRNLTLSHYKTVSAKFIGKRPNRRMPPFSLLSFFLSSSPTYVAFSPAPFSIRAKTVVARRLKRFPSPTKWAEKSDRHARWRA